MGEEAADSVAVSMVAEVGDSAEAASTGVAGSMAGAGPTAAGSIATEVLESTVAASAVVAVSMAAASAMIHGRDPTEWVAVPLVDSTRHGTCPAATAAFEATPTSARLDIVPHLQVARQVFIPR